MHRRPSVAKTINDFGKTSNFCGKICYKSNRIIQKRKRGIETLRVAVGDDERQVAALIGRHRPVVDLLEVQTFEPRFDVLEEFGRVAPETSDLKASRHFDLGLLGRTLHERARHGRPHEPAQ